MQYLNKFYKIQRTKAYNALARALRKTEIDALSKKRERMVLFYRKHGLKLTQEAYGVKRTTLFNWYKKYKEDGIIGLINGNRCPKHKRQSAISKEIEGFILEYRQEHGKIHKDEIKPHLDKYCKSKGIKTTSVSSIGRIIRMLKDKGLLTNGVRCNINGKTGNINEVKVQRIIKERRKKYQPQYPGDLVQADSVHLIIEGKKRYLINAIDLAGRLAFSYQYDRLSSANAADFFKKLRSFFPFAIKRIQTDNGGEFAGYAHDYLTANNLTHFFNYPHCPKSNAHIERFNRTIKEQFVYRNEDCIQDTKQANERIKDYLFWYNTKRHHKALNYQTPLNFTNNLLFSKKSHML